MMPQTNHNDRKNKTTDYAPDMKPVQQSDENISREKIFKKGKGKVIGERQNYIN